MTGSRAAIRTSTLLCSRWARRCSSAQAPRRPPAHAGARAGAAAHSRATRTGSAAAQSVAVAAQRRAIDGRGRAHPGAAQPPPNTAWRAAIRRCPFVALEVTPAARAALEPVSRRRPRVRRRDRAPGPGAERAARSRAIRRGPPGYDGTRHDHRGARHRRRREHPFLGGRVIDEACFSSTVPGVSQSTCPERHRPAARTGSRRAVLARRLPPRHARRRHRRRQRLGRGRAVFRRRAQRPS